MENLIDFNSSLLGGRPFRVGGSSVDWELTLKVKIVLAGSSLLQCFHAPSLFDQL